jgi:hypothetical protein
MEQLRQRAAGEDPNLNWKEMVLKRLGKDVDKPDPGYEFTGRKFDTPTNGGPYRHD